MRSRLTPAEVYAPVIACVAWKLVRNHDKR